MFLEQLSVNLMSHRHELNVFSDEQFGIKAQLTVRGGVHLGI